MCLCRRKPANKNGGRPSSVNALRTAAQYPVTTSADTPGCEPVLAVGVASGNTPRHGISSLCNVWLDRFRGEKCQSSEMWRSGFFGLHQNTQTDDHDRGGVIQVADSSLRNQPLRAIPPGLPPRKATDQQQATIAGMSRRDINRPRIRCPRKRGGWREAGVRPRGRCGSQSPTTPAIVIRWAGNYFDWRYPLSSRATKPAP